MTPAIKNYRVIDRLAMDKGVEIRTTRRGVDNYAEGTDWHRLPDGRIVQSTWAYGMLVACEESEAA